MYCSSTLAFSESVLYAYKLLFDGRNGRTFCCRTSSTTFQGLLANRVSLSNGRPFTVHDVRQMRSTLWAHKGLGEWLQSLGNGKQARETETETHIHSDGDTQRIGVVLV